MRFSVAAVALCVAACSTASQPAVQTSRSTPFPESTVGLRGDLPVFEYGIRDAQGNPQQVGGFLRFPGGIFQRDPRAGMVLDNTGDRIFRLLRTTVQPYLFGFSDSAWGETTYDRAAGRWLPVARAQVSGDGLRYAYRELMAGPNATGDQPPVGVRLHVVDVRSGSDRGVYSDNGKPGYNIVGFVQQALFVVGCGGWGWCGPL